MKIKGLLIAAALLAVLSGLVWWSQKKQQSDAGKPADDAPPKILTLNQAQIDELKITQAGGDPLVVAKLAGRWDIVKPQAFPADQDAVLGVLTTASSLTADRLIDDKPAGLAPFGLQTPSTEIALHQTTGQTVTIQLGGPTPTGNVYAKLASEARVFSVPAFAKTNLNKTVNDLRDKRLLTFDSDKLSRLEITSKGATGEFGKNASGDWTILKPEPARADGLQVEDLIRKLKMAHIDLAAGPVTTPPGPLETTVKVTDASSVQTLEVHRDNDKNAVAKSSVVPGVWKIDATLADALAKPATDLRNKKLLDFGFDELSQVTAQNAAYQKSGDNWMNSGKQMDASSVTAYIDKLRDLTAIGFAPKAAGATVFEASVLTVDKRHSEKVTITRDATGTFATRAGEPTVYLLDNSAADDLKKAAAAIVTAKKK